MAVRSPIPAGAVAGRPGRVALLAALLGAALLAGVLALLGAFDRGGGAAQRLTPAQVVQRYDARVTAVVRRALASTAGVEVARADGALDVGSGVVVGADGLILTNAHVVAGAQDVRVTVGVPANAVPAGAEVVARAPAGVRGGATIVRVPATVAASDRARDLAVLHADAGELTPLPLTGARGLRLGDSVIAIGYALALTGGPSVTKGIVSGVGRDVESRGGTRYRHLIQTDAPINRGNSGGPLLDSDGRVVGIDTLAAAAGSAEDVGFAIDAADARGLVKLARDRLAEAAG